MFVEANINNSAKCQLYLPRGFWGVDFLNIVLQSLPFSCHGNKKGMFGRGPLKKHLCKSFVKISVMR